MSNLLYHAYLPENHDHHVSLEEIMSDGIKSSTKSNNRYSNGGIVNFEITDLLRPSNTPDWLNFKEAIGVDITNRFSNSFCFPIFTDKILIFDGDISLSVYDQAFYDENKYTFEEALDFDTGETIEYWIKLYWKSMMTLEEYLIKRPYPKSEVLIFEPVPKDIIKICEE
ncbi:DNA polymerase III [Salipaludibacillus sp. LMS25]|uniref:DNA polymerase III n=1 Tax=Salipaludibacillus sp. LMS25 TaxID=2924031 RepID=UPI0020D1E8C2|nr:DNA polymerase III [Salipaludibacillus sp. LMS25]UTR16754.1 DNA polymerase III [Salipaludibacillus sp. LMS25]